MTDADAVLAGLDPEQRAAAEAVSGPVCILAGAGTGKTRAITHRIAYAVHSGAVPADHLLAVTFTTRAAGQMRTRLRALGVPRVQARTFHSAALRQLQFFAPSVLQEAENLQRMGAFKFRGAFNTLAKLPAERRRAGVVAYSSGNHAQAVALAARLLDLPATIVMPLDAPAARWRRPAATAGRS